MCLRRAYIALKNPEIRDIKSNGIPLIHEAAHWKHALRPDLTVRWLDLFVDKNEYVTPYAGTTGSQGVVNAPKGKPIRRRFHGILIESYGSERDIGELKFQLKFIPKELMVFDHVRIEPGLNGPGYFYPDKEVPTQYAWVCEDIAETTQWAYVIYSLGLLKWAVLERVNGSQTIQDKIAVLAEEGFISPDVANMVLDAKWRSMALTSENDDMRNEQMNEMYINSSFLRV
jgi:hypothetical protein